MNADTLKKWAECAREVADVVRDEDTIDGETWVEADWLATELDRAYFDAVTAPLPAASPLARDGG